MSIADEDPWYPPAEMTTYHFLQGCYTQADSYEEVLERLRDAIRLHVEERVAAGDEIPQPDSASLTSLDIAV